MLDVAEAISGEMLAQATLILAGPGSTFAGEFTPGTETQSTIDVVAYPTGPRDIAMLPEGDQGKPSMTFIGQIEMPIANEKTQAPAAQIAFNGERWKVTSSEAWGSFYRAVTVRHAP